MCPHETHRWGLWSLRGRDGGALADQLVSLYEDTQERRARLPPCSSPQRKQMQGARSRPWQAGALLQGFSSGLPASSGPRGQLLLFKAPEPLRWRMCLCSGHVFSPEFLEASRGTPGRRLQVRTGDWRLWLSLGANEWPVESKTVETAKLEPNPGSATEHLGKPLPFLASLLQWFPLSAAPHAAFKTPPTPKGGSTLSLHYYYYYYYYCSRDSHSPGWPSNSLCG